MDIAILLYDKFTALDCIGPYEVLSRLPGAEVKFTAVERGLVRSDTGGLAIHADFALADVPRPEILLIPGGPGEEAAAANPAVLDWVRSVHEHSTWTTSVCTGSLILALAGVLDGVEATTHWARRDRLRELGATPIAERVVRRGKIVTAAGVSAGIDMGLTLAAEIAGEDFAQAIQLGIEYDPQPPFDAGSPERAPAQVVEMLLQLYPEAQTAD